MCVKSLNVFLSTACMGFQWAPLNNANMCFNINKSILLKPRAEFRRAHPKSSLQNSFPELYFCCILQRVMKGSSLHSAPSRQWRLTAEQLTGSAFRFGFLWQLTVLNAKQVQKWSPERSMTPQKWQSICYSGGGSCTCWHVALNHLQKHTRVWLPPRENHHTLQRLIPDCAAVFKGHAQRIFHWDMISIFSAAAFSYCLSQTETYCLTYDSETREESKCTHIVNGD